MKFGKKKTMECDRCISLENLITRCEQDKDLSGATRAKTALREHKALAKARSKDILTLGANAEANFCNGRIYRRINDFDDELLEKIKQSGEVCDVPKSIDLEKLETYTYKELMKEKNRHNIRSKKETPSLIKNIRIHYQLYH